MVQLEHPDKDQIYSVQWLPDLPQVNPSINLTGFHFFFSSIFRCFLFSFAVSFCHSFLDPPPPLLLLVFTPFISWESRARPRECRQRSSGVEIRSSFKETSCEELLNMKSQLLRLNCPRSSWNMCQCVIHRDRSRVNQSDFPYENIRIMCFIRWCDVIKWVRDKWIVLSEETTHCSKRWALDDI